MPIYCDNNATTAVDPDFIPHLTRHLYAGPINPSSVHRLGQEGKQLLSDSRSTVARYLRVPPSTITFTSGGTESLNTLILGVVRGQHFDCILSTHLEHACVYETVKELESTGHPVTYLNPNGAMSLLEQLQSIPHKKVCVILSSVNSETGDVLPLEVISALCFQKNWVLLIDGVAQLGKMKLNIYPGITGMGFSGHKIHALKGVGFYYLKESTPFHPVSYGGPQERQKRPGTENLLGIISLTLAIEKLEARESEIFQTLADLTSQFIETLHRQGCSPLINGVGPRIANMVNLHFPGIDGETLLIALDQRGVCCSTGAACASGGLTPSRVLIQLGYGKVRAKESLRFSFSRLNTPDEVIQAAQIVAETCAEIKNIFVKNKKPLLVELN